MCGIKLFRPSSNVRSFHPLTNWVKHLARHHHTGRFGERNVLETTVHFDTIESSITEFSKIRNQRSYNCNQSWTRHTRLHYCHGYNLPITSTRKHKQRHCGSNSIMSEKVASHLFQEHQCLAAGFLNPTMMQSRYASTYMGAFMESTPVHVAQQVCICCYVPPFFCICCLFPQVPYDRVILDAMLHQNFIQLGLIQVLVNFRNLDIDLEVV